MIAKTTDGTTTSTTKIRRTDNPDRARLQGALLRVVHAHGKMAAAGRVGRVATPAILFVSLAHVIIRIVTKSKTGWGAGRNFPYESRSI